MPVALAKYQKFRDSGIPWMAEIPIEWDIQRGKWLFLKAERSTTANDGVVTAFRDGQVTLRTNRRTAGFTNAIQEHGYQGIRKGDLVIHAMDAFAGAIGVSESDGKSSPVYSACVPRGIFPVSPYFYAYAVRYMALSSYVLSLAKGIRERSTDFRFNDFGNLELPVPDLDTQNCIVSFLDEKTAEIDAAIQKKRRLIDLLNEQKAVLINRAVTKGLNPDAPMKDSGVDWIGEIPAHWEVKRLKFLSSVQAGITLGKSFPGHQEEYTYLRVANVQAGYFKLKDLASILLPPSIAKRHRVRTGDILVTEGGDLDKLGRGTVWRGEVDYCLHQNHVFAVRVSEKIVGREFVSLCLESDYGRRYFTTTANKTTNLASTNQEKLGNFPVVVPDLNEQEKLCVTCENIKSEFSIALTLQSRLIDALHEFKQTLIANAVTGKIKI